MTNSRGSPPGCAARPWMMTCSKPSPLSRGGQGPHHRHQFIERQVDGRPHIQHHPIPLRPALGRPGDQRLADGVQAAAQHVFEFRHGDNRARSVAERGQVADLGQGDEPLITGRVATDTVKQRNMIG